MDGILAVWKPAGWTSHDVVAKVRGMLRIKRIGHAGTLDPEVTGVLPLCIGRATRVVEYLQERPKAYEAVLELGVATDTEDLTGEVIETADHISVNEEAIRQVLRSFVGEIEQVPPMYSAVRVEGRRLYELAREGKVVERKKRQVTIYELELLSMSLELDRPRFSFSVTCSKGTYIRTLCVDIGKALGVPAAMAELRRTQSAGFGEADCLTMEQIRELHEQGVLSEHLLSPDQGLTNMQRLVVDARSAERALKGQKLQWPALSAEPTDGQLVRLYDETDAFLGIYRADAARGLICPVKVFS
ncbi:tRNA pseudouridine(55) synthase TruB [Paenibacillus daejeonensis]|uniref:tRNA pseudouridine(55) synthase TruB n=1 Tax=Paenibacillus daejeonensis TaxID=135193 RepID=UPI0003770C1F|nr:tRNA pseudouridine(55) synthase TruB [Paenibacillus daejeonensis]